MPQKEPFRLKSCIKRYSVDQDKAVDPLTTVKSAIGRLKKRYDLSNVRIEPRKDAVEGAYSFSSLSDQLAASGKGLTPEQSKASAIMEFAERYSWLHFDCEKYDGYTVKSYNQIKKGDIRTVDESYFLSNFIGLKNKRELLDEIKVIPLKWVKGLSLIDYKNFYYPINWHNYIFTSNGLATGNVMEEAIIQALCEVIERENVYRFLGDGRVGNDINQKWIINPLIARVLENSKKEGITFIIKDISFDFKVPTFIVQGTNPADKQGLTYQGCGYGTHPNPEKALIRALAEYFEGYSLLKNVEKEIELDWGKVIERMQKRNYGFLSLYNPEMFEKRKRIIKLSDIKNISREDIKDEIEHVLNVLKKHGYNPIFIDKTHPDLKVPVPRIFVPGFRNIIVNETRDPWFIMSECYYEASMVKESEEYLKQSLQRSMFHYPSIASVAKPKKIFRKDYKETLLFTSGFKKDILEILKMFDAVLKKYKPRLS